MINFYTYKEDVKRALIRRKEQLNIDDYPLDWAWITYAFSCEGTEDNPLLEPMLQQASVWVASEKALEYDRNIGALGIFCFVLSKAKHKNYEKINNLILEKVKDLTSKKLHKFHPLNDPEIVFGLSIGLGKGLSKEVPNLLLKHLKEGASSESLKRRLFFTTALMELGAETTITNLFPPVDQIRIDELIPAIWFVERYKDILNSQQLNHALWNMFAKTKEVFSFELHEGEGVSGQRVLSSAELAMLYEALVSETNKPDPDMLFDNHPLHPRIREVTESLYKKGEYFNAVFEATKVLNDFVRSITGLQESERKLMQKAFGGDDPPIKFNPLNKKATDFKSQKNEQEGLRLILEGIFAAFRHPKGHEPKDTSWGDISPYDALDQLITITHIMKRIENADKGDGSGEN